MNEASRAMPLRAGDDIVIRALHSDGALYRWRRAVVEEAHADRVVTYAGAGGAILSPAYGRTVSREPVRSVFYVDRPYSVFEFHNTTRRGGPGLYVNLNAPAVINPWSITYVDHELDVAKDPGQPAVIIDEDEFLEACARFGYSEAFQAGVRAAAQEGLRVVETWNSGPIRHDLRVIQAGDAIRVRAMRPDGKPDRWWRARVEDISETGLVTVLSIGQLLRHARGAWRTRLNLRAHYWFDRPYSLVEAYDAGGRLVEMVVKVATTPRLRAGALQFTDYGLDVAVSPGQPPRPVADDGFDAAAQRQRRSPELARWARAASRDGLALAAEWRPRGWYEGV